MMRLRLQFESNLDSLLIKSYVDFIFRSIKKDIKKSINHKKYQLRGPLVLESSVMKWITVPSKINLEKYVNDCLELVREKDAYVIRLDSSKKVPGSGARVCDLVRLLEYGNEKVPAYPLIRLILFKYSQIYRYLFVEFVEDLF